MNEDLHGSEMHVILFREASKTEVGIEAEEEGREVVGRFCLLDVCSCEMLCNGGSSALNGVSNQIDDSRRALSPRAMAGVSSAGTQDGTLKKFCMRRTYGCHTLPRAELLEPSSSSPSYINNAGLDQIRVDAQFLLTSIARTTKAKLGSHGDLWTRLVGTRAAKQNNSVHLLGPLVCGGAVPLQKHWTVAAAPLLT